MNDKDLESLKSLAERANAKREPCCKNCAWFGGQTCFRYPPARVKGGWSRPAVDENDLCGEFMHRTTGDTFQGRDHRLAALRALVGELEDKIDRMRE